MNKQQQKIVQYLNEAHGSELALVRQLQAQIAMTPKGQYRDGLETHLQETRRHAERVEARLAELGQGDNPLQVGLGAVESLIGQALALTKTPLDLVRGTGGEEKVLKNAKDSCAAEALEIATYTAIGRLASDAGDGTTQSMCEAAAEPRREVGGTAKRTTRQARKVPGVARAEGTVKGAVASESDLAISNYDSLRANEVQDKLSGLSQVDLAKVDAYERKNQNRSTITSRIDSLQAFEPWPGYDELGVEEIRAVLDEGDDTRIKSVRTYERKHKNRAGVVQATERELSNA